MDQVNEKEKQENSISFKRTGFDDEDDISDLYWAKNELSEQYLFKND